MKVGSIFFFLLFYLWTFKSFAVVVAVIDTGADVTHKDLKGVLWQNPNETANGVDDDGNGLIDDLVGWDFSSGTSDVTDTDGHGTHIAGLIKKSFFENHGSSPLEMMILKYTEKSGRNSKSSFLDALEYVINNRADVINISASGKGFSKREFDLLKRAYEFGIQVVVSTGNKNPNAPDTMTYPASYHLGNIHPVGALNKEGSLLEISNSISRQGVLYALGENVLSTLPKQKYGMKTGTSQATALVTGRIAAALKKHTLGRTFDQRFVSFP